MWEGLSLKIFRIYTLTLLEVMFVPLPQCTSSSLGGGLCCLQPSRNCLSDPYQYCGVVLRNKIVSDNSTAFVAVHVKVKGWCILAYGCKYEIVRPTSVKYKYKYVNNSNKLMKIIY